jgi:hypothetical protein
MKLSGFTVTDAAMRPASPVRQCFYCHQPIGKEHKFECVLVSKRVRVKAIIEYEIDVPAHWSKEDVEFSRNESSWCADNIVGDLERHIQKMNERGFCMCDDVYVSLLDDSEEYFLDEK